MKEPIFYTAKGELTAYAFACGYQTTVENTPKHEWLRIYKDGCYHVAGTGLNGNGRVWETFQYLADAKKRFNQIKRGK